MQKGTLILLNLNAIEFHGPINHYLLNFYLNTKSKTVQSILFASDILKIVFGT